jgi:hypothetical protein
MKNIVEKYRQAAMKLWGASREEVEHYIIAADEDPGEWAPEALVILRLEPNGAIPNDTYSMPNMLGMYTGDWIGNGVALAQEAGEGFVEHVNGAIAAVWPE